MNKVICDKCKVQMQKYGIKFEGLDIFIAYGCIKCLGKKFVREEDDK